MDPACTTTPALEQWSRESGNKYNPGDMTACWNAHDAITFLADIGMYDPSCSAMLDPEERKQKRAFRSEYFRRRFTLSRWIMKNVLRQLTGPEVILKKERTGRIAVTGRPDIWLSLSYSGPCMAITLGKKKIGSDIEIIRPLDSRKLGGSSHFIGTKGDPAHHFLRQWTMLEAYAKLHDLPLYPLVKERFPLADAHFRSYCIDRRTILSLATGSPLWNTTLLWTDLEEWQQTGEKTPAASRT